MTAHVVLSCDREFREGKCPAQVRVFGVVDVDAARRAAGDAGWHAAAVGDRCPTCAGRREVSPPLIVTPVGRPR